MGPGVPLTPEAEQADLDKAQARIAVVALTEGGDEVQNRGLEIGVLIVGGAAAAVLGVGGAADGLRQIAGYSRWLGRVVQVHPQDHVVSTGLSGRKKRLEADIKGLTAGVPE